MTSDADGVSEPAPPFNGKHSATVAKKNITVM
jgi:hypothetical protein